MSREQETLAALHQELKLLRTTNEKQHNQMQECVRELTVSLHDARKDRDAHFAQCQSLRLDLAEAQASLEKERLRNQDLQHRIQTLSTPLVPSEPDGGQPGPPSRAPPVWAPALEVCVRPSIAH